jgi:hypothetical protein
MDSGRLFFEKWLVAISVPVKKIVDSGRRQETRDRRQETGEAVLELLLGRKSRDEAPKVRSNLARGEAPGCDANIREPQRGGVSTRLLRRGAAQNSLELATRGFTPG